MISPPKRAKSAWRSIRWKNSARCSRWRLRDVRYSEGKLLFGDENPRDVVALSAPFRH